MRKEEINDKIFDIFNKVSECVSFNDIKLLYLEYLKLSVYLYNKPSFYDSIDYTGVNCYMYSLMLDLPNIFQKELLNKFNPGFISGKTSKNDLVNLFFDLDELGINYYEINKEDTPTHGGYKILMFQGSGDFHFRRQNTDGTYSEKLGFSKYIKECTDPFNYHDYKLIKTLEIIKPTLQK